GPQQSSLRCLTGVAAVLLMLLSSTLHAACKLSDIDQEHGDQLAYDAEESRNQLETLALSENPRDPADTLGSRLAWTEVAQALSDSSTLKILSDLPSKMSTAADRAAVVAEFSKTASTTARALQKSVDYLTVFSTKARDPSIARAAAKLRDQMSEFAAL